MKRDELKETLGALAASWRGIETNHRRLAQQGNAAWHDQQADYAKARAEMTECRIAALPADVIPQNWREKHGAPQEN